MKGRSLSAILAASGMLLLILDGKTALAGAAEGVGLCIRSLIPSLFPFFVLSSVLTNTMNGQALPFFRGIGKLCRMPEGSEYLFAVGALGGYPMGAQSVAQAYRQGALSRTDARRMMAFCNNAGPSFVFGIVAPFFSLPCTGWMLWAIQILSAIMVAILIPSNKPTDFTTPENSQLPFTKLLEKSLRSIGLVCGWVILFRMLLSFLNKWVLWLFPPTVQVAVAGILELTNGCLQLGAVQSEGLRFILASVMLSFGGLCVLFQTVSVSERLSMSAYLPAKVLQSILSAMLAIVVQGFFPAGIHISIPVSGILYLCIIGSIIVISLRFFEKRCSIPAPIGV